ncbi:MAG TPA: pitrilysin family protein, partial [Thermoanaerobaculia bacterium]|nr:pitrilysin family protein [Thermoanaerobaculia bacterium]
MRTYKLLPCLVALACLAAIARPAGAADGMDVDIPYTKFTLDNGLTVIVHEDHKAPIVAVNVWYHVGSKNEKPGRTGFAHLFEHLMFNGSENYDQDYFRAVEDVGATDLNGTTNYDRTNYFQNVPVSAFDRVLFLESDRMGHLLGAVTQEKIDEQRGVVQNEKRQFENEPYTVSDELIQNGAFPAGHPYSWTVIGSMEDLDAAALDDVHQWFKDYYGAANATVVIAGDVDVETARAKVEQYFGDVPPGPPVARVDQWVASRDEEKRQRVEDRVPQARLYKVWNAPGFATADSDYLDLVSDVMARGKSSRLYKRLVYDDRIASEVQAYVDVREVATLFVVEATAVPGGDLAAVEAAVDEEMARLLAEGPTAAEVERASAGHVAGFLRGAERIGGFGGKSDVLARCQVYAGSPDCWQTTIDRVRAATPKQLTEAANRWLGKGPYVLEIHPYREYQTAEGIDRSELPQPGEMPAPEFPAIQRAELSNGLEVVLVERDAMPLVQATLMVDSGYAADQGAHEGTAAFTMSMLDEGTEGRSAIEISDQLAALGANLGAGSDLDVAFVNLQAVKANLAPSLALMADVVLNPAFPEAEVERLRAERIAAVQREKVSPVSIALRLMPKLMFGEGHAYATSFTGLGGEESLAAISRDDLARWHATWFKPNNATLVVSGDVSMSELRPQLEKLFAGWKQGEVPKKNVTEVANGERVVYFIDRPGSIQSLLLAGQVAPPRGRPDELAFDTAVDVLGGGFVSRLNMNLREDKGWAYGAGAFLPDAAGQRPLILFAPVQSDQTGPSMAEMDREVRAILADQPVTEAELARVKKDEILSLP